MIVSGAALALRGAAWHITSSTGAYVDSVHYWSVQLFFFFLALHVIAQLVQASWRRGRGLTWLVGGIALSTAIVTSLTGYLSQQNFEAQWVATQAKDGINAAGLAGIFNPMDGGQVLTLHVVLLPAALVALVAVHILLVRWRGICPPLDVPTAIHSTAYDSPEVQGVD